MINEEWKGRIDPLTVVGVDLHSTGRLNLLSEKHEVNWRVDSNCAPDFLSAKDGK